MKAGRGCGWLAPLLLAGSCTLGWHHDGGPRTLAPADAPGTTGAADDGGAAPRDSSRAVALVLPPEWSWYVRGHDLVATKDGVFLGHLLIERIHADQREESVGGAFPFEARSAKEWPIRTVRHLGRQFVRGMAPLDAAAVLLESRRNDPAVSSFDLVQLTPRTVAGRPGFKAVFEFRLQPAAPADLEIGAYAWDPFAMQGRATPYRTSCFGFVLDDWFYPIECTAARRHYADACAGAFDAIVQSVRLVEPSGP